MVRIKHRYILTEIGFEDEKERRKIDTSKLYWTIRNSIQLHFGDFGMGSLLSSLQVKYWNKETGICIIRCSRDQYQLCWSSLTWVTNMFETNSPVSMRVIHVGGTIKMCLRSALEYDRSSLLLECAKEEEEED
eukprot:TRINITY_DN5333_c0_g1_i2.p1 TRINITY_DN5333_c0_g1~~TRINITY_DN5333_c0_g1_i2.p1  ORF type:complete len:133 (-),score=32.13 TRINITY_DN5333_c0_g1_i2:206-604(-)